MPASPSLRTLSSAKAQCGPLRQGKGVGQRLLADDLALWDADGVPAYLESTNVGNNHRYSRAGFAVDGGFAAVRDDTWITVMWRPIGGAFRS